jgi:acyl carrier protein
MTLDDTNRRLTKCFSAVFPELTENAIHSASPETVPAWDSLASVTLTTVVEEEFALEIDAEDIESLVSFQKLLEYLRARVQPS